MTWNKLYLLLPSFLVYFAVLSALATALWYAFTKFYPTFEFKWQAPVLLAFAVSFYSLASTTLAIHQNQILIADHQATQQRTQAQQPPQELDPIVKRKNEFLRTIEVLASNPTQITDEAKKRLNSDFASLFKDANEKSRAYSAIKTFYDCQRYLWEDALTAFKSKKQIKSDSRKSCESVDGSFFQRERLLAPEVVKNNDTLISNLAAGKRIPASDGRQIEITEEMLRQSLDANINTAQAVKKLLD